MGFSTGKNYVLFGGSGFVGTHLSRWLLADSTTERVHVADIRKPSKPLDDPRFTYSTTDVRSPIGNAGGLRPDWIVNLAAVHREPGHQPREYFETNILGARNVVDFAARVACANILFTSSISVYGPTHGPTNEESLTCPTTPYGASKIIAESVHREWMLKHRDRRLIIVRPGVLYGPGDQANIMRMIRAVRKGYFYYPGDSSIKKSSGYIYNLIDSMGFVERLGLDHAVYNYVDYPTPPLSQMVEEISGTFGSRLPVMSVPLWLLLPLGALAKAVTRGKGAIDPTRIRKAATPTDIVPGFLEQNGFMPRFDFAAALSHWKSERPDDFSLEAAS